MSWNLYYHDPVNKDWTISGYELLVKNIDSIDDINEIFKIVAKWNWGGMYYLMRNGYKPLWDAPENINGGAYTFKIHLSKINEVWSNILSECIKGTLCNKMDEIVGISISPKQQFATLRIWFKNTSTRNGLQFKNINIDFNRSRIINNKDQNMG